MIVVSDTSAITSLLQVGRVQLLARLYQEVVIAGDKMHRVAGFRISNELKARPLPEAGE